MARYTPEQKAAWRQLNELQRQLLTDRPLARESEPFFSWEQDGTGIFVFIVGYGRASLMTLEVLMDPGEPQEVVFTPATTWPDFGLSGPVHICPQLALHFWNGEAVVRIHGLLRHLGYQGSGPWTWSREC